jgi:hypothetical protein
MTLHIPTSVIADALHGTPKAPKQSRAVTQPCGHDMFTRHMLRTLDGFVPPLFPSDAPEVQTGHAVFGDEYNELYPCIQPPPMSPAKIRRAGRDMRMMAPALADLAG